MLPPNNRPLSELAAEEGISEATLYNWRRQAREQGRLLPDADAGPEGWSAADKFAAVLETAALNEAELAEYCPGYVDPSPDGGSQCIPVPGASSGETRRPTCTTRPPSERSCAEATAPVRAPSASSAWSFRS